MELFFIGVLIIIEVYNAVKINKIEKYLASIGNYDYEEDFF